MEQPATSAVVLAGGASSRMGFNKAFAVLEGIKAGQRATLIETVVARVMLLSADVIVVGNDERSVRGLGVQVVRDVYPGTGSLGGIYSGILAAQHEHCLTVACDMPFLNLRLWRHMLRLPRDYDVLMPRLGGHPEPLHAIYSKRCLTPVKALLDRGHLKIIDFLGQVRVRFLEEEDIDRFDPGHASFFNVNTPADLALASKMQEASAADRDEETA